MCCLPGWGWMGVGGGRQMVNIGWMDRQMSRWLDEYAEWLRHSCAVGGARGAEAEWCGRVWGMGVGGGPQWMYV